MSKAGAQQGGGVGPLKMVDAAAATSADVASYNLESPSRFFGMQLITGASSAVFVLQGALTSDSTSMTTLLTYSSGVSGGILSTESTAPISFLTGSLDGAATSGETVDVWVTATP